MGTSHSKVGSGWDRDKASRRLVGSGTMAVRSHTPMIIAPRLMPKRTHRPRPASSLAMVASLAVFLLGLVPTASRGAQSDDVSKAQPGRTLLPAATRPVDYARDIAPILSRNCYRCHGPKKEQGG